MSYKNNIIRALLITVASAVASFDTEAAIVKGEVCDSLTREGIPFATVKVFSESDTISPVALFATDVNDVFSESIKKTGDLRMRFESIGKKTVIRNLTVNGEEYIDLGSIPMADDEQLLGEVEVVAMLIPHISDLA